MLTEEQKTKYLGSPYLCPYCGSDELSLGKATADVNRAVQNISCQQCKKRWTNIYTLALVEEDEWDMRRREVKPKEADKSPDDFKRFCVKWVDVCLEIAKLDITKGKKGRTKGDKFEEEFDVILQQFVPDGYRMVRQKRVRGIDYKFDFLFVKSEGDAEEVSPEDVIAAFEVKAHGFYSYSAISKVVEFFRRVRDHNSKIRLFYITFRETNTYDRKVKDIFQELATNYYRLSDSGDGVQLTPRKYFPENWERMMNDLSELRKICNL